MRSARVVPSWAVMIAYAALGTTASKCAPAAGTHADSSARVHADTAKLARQTPGYASLFVRATEQRQPLVGGVVIIEGLKLGALLNEDGRATIDEIRAGKRVVRWSLIGYELRRDTLTFTAGQRETLLVTDPAPKRHAPEDDLVLTADEVGFRPTVARDHPLRRRLGVVWVSGDTTTMFSESDSLAPGSVVTVLLMDGSGEPRTTRVLARLGREDPAQVPIFIVRSRPLWSYRLARPDRREKSVRVGLGVVDLHGEVRRVGRRLAADLDGDGTSELVTRCADPESLLLLVRAEQDHRLLWRARCYERGHAVEPACTDEDTELE